MSGHFSPVFLFKIIDAITEMNGPPPGRFPLSSLIEIFRRIVIFWNFLIDKIIETNGPFPQVFIFKIIDEILVTNGQCIHILDHLIEFVSNDPFLKVCLHENKILQTNGSFPAFSV